MFLSTEKGSLGLETERFLKRDIGGGRGGGKKK